MAKKVSNKYKNDILLPLLSFLGMGKIRMKGSGLYMFFTLLFIGIGLRAQVKIKGQVFDEEGQTLPYADIYFKDTNVGTASDIEGNFYLQSDTYYPEIKVSFTGFEDKIIKVKEGYQEIKVTLKLYLDDANKLGKVVVRGKKRIKYRSKKENPAYRILRNVWAHRKHNGLKKVHDYQYDKYQKIELDINSIDSQFTKKKIFNKFHFIFNKMDTSKIFGDAFLPIFLNESLSKVYGLNKPKKKRKDLIANKASGFENRYALIGTVKELYTDFDIYDNQIVLFNKPFASPLASNGFSFYEYQLVDSIYIDGKKTYRMKYFPKNRISLAFEGTVWIVDKLWAVSDITLKANKDINANFVKDIYIEQAYEVLNDSVFITKSDYALLNLSLISKRKKAKGMYARRTRIFKNYVFDLHRPSAFYDVKKNPYKKSVYDKSDEFWKKNRYEALGKNEKGIYETLDSLNKIPRFQHIVDAVEVLSTGYLPTGKIEYGNIYNTIGSNDIEGIRIRSGFRTWFDVNDRARLRGYLAYGTKDKQFKYGIEGKYLLNRPSRWIVGVGTKRDIEQLGSQLISDEGVLTRSFGSSSILSGGGNNQLSTLNKTNVFTSFELFVNGKLRLDATYQTIKSASSVFNADFYLQPESNPTANTKTISHLTDSRIALSFSAYPGRKFAGSGVERYNFDPITIYPTIIVKYTKGLKGALHSTFNYDKIEGLYKQPILLSTLGVFQTTLSFAKTFGNIPLSLLNIIPANESYGYVANTFGLMNYYEFVTDRYASMHFEHHLGGRLFNKIPLIKKLKFREIFFLRGVWGKLSTNNLNMIADHKLRENIQQYGFKENKPYYEYGFGIENIGLGNLRFFRIDFNWRGNYLDHPKAKKFGIKVGLRLRF